MDKPQKEKISLKPLYISLLKFAEVQYKFAHALNISSLTELTYPEVFSFGKHITYKKDFELTKEQEEQGAMFVSHSAVYLMAVQIDSVLSNVFGDKRFSHDNKDIASTAQIIRLIRNSFAHNPFYPVWLIHRNCKDKVFRVEKVNVELNTKGLNNKLVDRADYGGPLALLKLSEFTRNIIESL